MRAHTGKALAAGIAVAALALGACSSSGGSNSSNTGNPSKPGSAPASGTDARSGVGTKGTGNFASCVTDANNCNSGSTKQGGTVTYVLEKTIPGWNNIYADSNVFELAEVLDGVEPSVYIGTPDLKPTLNTDLMVSATQTKANPQTLVYKINPNAVWSDGVPINFDDFQYIKNTSDGTTCPKCGAASTSGYNQIASMSGSDNGKTVTVVMKSPFADWQSMFGPLLPAHIAKMHGGVTGAAQLNASFLWFNKVQPTFSGGPYMITGYTKDQSVTETPNPKWYGKTKPSLDKLIFRIITDQTQEPAALSNNEVQVLYSQPSADLVSQTDNLPNVSTYLGKGLTWEHLSFNEKNKFLSDKALRTAIFTAVSRKDIIQRTVGQFVPNVQPLGSHIYVPGQPGYTDNVTSTKQGSGDIAAAKQILTDAGYTGVGTALKTKTGETVTFRCTYSAGNTNRQQICEIVQAEMKQLGINITLKTTTDLSELGTGDYDLIVFAWVGAPFVVAGAQQIYELHGGADFGSNNDPAVESLINQAAKSTDPSQVQTLMNQADVKLTADAYELPLFQKPTYMAAYNNVANIRDDATSTGPPYNVQDWGLHS